jgi:hypothetical protein
VSGWGGLVAVARYLEKVGIRQLLERGLPDGRTSPNQIPVVEMVLAFFATVLSGGRRFAHAERLRSDEVVKAILGLERMPWLKKLPWRRAHEKWNEKSHVASTSVAAPQVDIRATPGRAKTISPVPFSDRPLTALLVDAHVRALKM